MKNAEEMREVRPIRWKRRFVLSSRARLTQSKSHETHLHVVSFVSHAVWSAGGDSRSFDGLLPFTSASTAGSQPLRCSRSGSQTRKIEGWRKTSMRPKIYKSRSVARRLGRGRKEREIFMRVDDFQFAVELLPSVRERVDVACWRDGVGGRRKQWQRRRAPIPETKGGRVRASSTACAAARSSRPE
jgi:hypothetical protein